MKIVIKLLLASVLLFGINTSYAEEIIEESTTEVVVESYTQEEKETMAADLETLYEEERKMLAKYNLIQEGLKSKIDEIGQLNEEELKENKEYLASFDTKSEELKEKIGKLEDIVRAGDVVFQEEKKKIAGEKILIEEYNETQAALQTRIDTGEEVSEEELSANRENAQVVKKDLGVMRGELADESKTKSITNFFMIQEDEGDKKINTLRVFMLVASLILLLLLILLFSQRRKK